MTEKIALVSGCDANYFPMLLELIHSVRRFPQSKNMDICIMNTGMTAEQHQKLENDYGCKVIIPEWPCKIPAYKIRGREYLKSCVCRPFIPKNFAGYDIYLWLDADIWVQNWRAVELYLEGARRGKLAITAQIDRAYLTYGQCG